jgi:NAD+ synthetase
MRIALAQINPTVGDVAANKALHLDALERAERRGAELVVFPELSLIGYPPRDLLMKPGAIEQCARALDEIAGRCDRVGAMVGLPMANDGPGRPLRNAAAVCRDGRVVDRRYKSLLPTYDVFDEHRYFEPGRHTDVTQFGPMRIGISVCEDLWHAAEHFERRIYHDNPIDQLAAAGAGLFVNCSASPFVCGKHDKRMDIMRDLGREHRLPIVFVNQVGANDELIFDGNSCVVDGRGEVIARGRAFEPDLVVVDVPGDTPQAAAGQPPAAAASAVASVYHALVLGVRDYCGKCGFESVVLGLSGGIDSAVTACVAAAAVGADHVTGVTMPSRYSSPGSAEDSQQLAERLGVTLHTIDIEPPHRAMEQTLLTLFAGTEPGIAEENIQARLRGVILMSISNKFGSLLITTGNKSEMAVGYCTLYGDMAGGLAVLSDVPKTLVYELARWMNTPQCPLHERLGGPPIPGRTIDKPPSAELRPDQKDSDSLPDYDVLDAIIDRYVERDMPVDQIISQTGYDADHVLARGEVGKVGVPISHLGDMRQLFDAIPLEQMNTSMTINATAMWLLALYIAVAEEQGADVEKLAGTIQNDILKEYLSRGTYAFPPEPSMRLTTDVIAHTVTEVPRWNPINICSYHLQEAGATPVQELAFALANAIAVLDAVRERGQVPDADFGQVVGRISFFVNAGIRFVEEVAKMRARIADAKPPEGPWDTKLGPGRLQEVELVAQACTLIAGQAARDVASGLEAGVAIGVLDDGEREALMRSYRLCWILVQAAKLLSDRRLDPEAIGEGGKAFVLRAAGFETIGGLQAALEEETGKAGAVIDAALGRAPGEV